MSEHVARIAWSRDGRDFAYASYGRTHEARLGGAEGPVSISAAAAYGGDATRANPEDLLVAALASCHMLTFLAICARKGVVVDRYEDDARGWLERPAGGPMQVTRVTLRPRIAFAAGPPDPATLADLHAQAHRGCFIANSVKTAVSVEPPA